MRIINTDIEQKDVEKAFLSVRGNKSHGLDNICRLLNISIKSLQAQHVPEVWKDAVVVPVPKSSRPKTVNNFRPVAFASILMKIFETLVRSEILRKTEHALDPMQFAKRPQRGGEDATVTLLNLPVKHLDGNGSHARPFDISVL